MSGHEDNATHCPPAPTLCPVSARPSSYVLYTPVLRSSHLERLAPVPGFRLVATGRHPDCDDALLAAAPFPVRLAPLETLSAELATDPPVVLEVTEPLWQAEWPAALRLAGAAPGARLVTYAIEVLPSDTPPAAGRLAAVAFGSVAAQQAYEVSYPDRAWSSMVVQERRPRCPRCFPREQSVRAQREVVFAAEFSERKAVDLLLPAWEQARAPGWRLRLLGWGPRTAAVLAWARGRDDVDVVVSADREQVHDALRRAAVVVLPSRRVPLWREQVGLSLVEGLAHGCRLLTTTETGLADQLAEQGHAVVRPDDRGALEAGLRSVLREAPLVKQLPVGLVDSRQRAQAWLAGA